MADRMLQFTTHRRRSSRTSVTAALRAWADFDEIYRDFRHSAGAASQSSRCSQCGVPFCSIHCPLNNNIPDWLKLTAEGRLDEAYEVSAATNNFPEICGRICPQDRLCEGNCVIERGFEIGHYRCCGTVRDRPCVHPGLGEAGGAAPRSYRTVGGDRGRRVRAGWPRRRNCAGADTRCMSMTGMTAWAG